MYSVIDIPELPGMGFPIQISLGQSLFSGSPKLIAASHVFHRHPAPRHPPSALSSLAININHLMLLVYFFIKILNSISKALLKFCYFTLYLVVKDHMR